MKKANIPVFVAHMGCPNDCVFCNQRRITGTDGVMTVEKCRKIIEEWLAFIKGEAEIAFFGGSFTGIDIDEQCALLETAAHYVDGKKITGIRLSTRPDYIDEKIIENLLSYPVTTVELGAQSTSAEVLRLSRRGHSADDIFRASELIKASGIDLGLQMMTHLPGADDEKDLKTCRDFISMKPSQVRIYPTLVLRDTCLCDMYRQGKYVPQSLSDAVGLAAELTDEFEREDISVIRVGLQPSESLDESFVAGPYHPSLGEMVESKRIFNRITALEVTAGKEIEVFCEDSFLSKLIGQKKSNLAAIEKTIGKNVVVKKAPKGTAITVFGKKIY